MVVRFVFLFLGTSSALSQKASYHFDVPIVWDKAFFFRPKAWYNRFEVEPLDKCSWKWDPCLALHILIQYSQLRMVSEAFSTLPINNARSSHYRLLTTEPNHSERFSEEGCDSVPHRRSVKLLGPGPLHFEFLNTFATMYGNLGSTLRWWLGLFAK